MKTTYCIIQTSNYNGKKCAPAQIIKEFSSRKTAENSNYCRGFDSVITKIQAEKIIEKWNKEFFNGDYDCK